MSITPDDAREANDSLKDRVRKSRAEEKFRGYIAKPGDMSEPDYDPSDEFGMDALDLAAYADVCRVAAVAFLDACSITPKPEAVAQLTEAFLPCLEVIATRDYRQDGAQWRGLGWRGVLHEMMKRMSRLEHSSWDNDRFDANAARDMINFTAYYLRLRNQGRPFGNKGNPGGAE